MAHTLTRLPRGSDSQFGFKKESIYGTAVVVDKFLEAFSLGLVPNPRPIEPKGWKPGLRGKRHDAYIAWVDGGAGAIGLEVPRAGSLGLWQAAFGGSNTCAIQGDRSGLPGHLLARRLHRRQRLLADDAARRADE